MKIIFDELEPGTRGSANGMWLKGTKDYDGSEYKKFYFDQTRDGDETKLHGLAKALKKGDVVELTFDNSKFKNLENIEKLDETAGSAESKGSGGSGGGSRKSGGNFRNPLHVDRASAAAQAWQVVKGMAELKGTKVTAKTEASIMAQYEDMTGKFYEYLVTGKFPNGNSPKEAPANADKPAAGAGDDDDIPF